MNGDDMIKKELDDIKNGQFSLNQEIERQIEKVMSLLSTMDTRLEEIQNRLSNIERNIA